MLQRWRVSMSTGHTHGAGHDACLASHLEGSSSSSRRAVTSARVACRAELTFCRRLASALQQNGHRHPSVIPTGNKFGHSQARNHIKVQLILMHSMPGAGAWYGSNMVCQHPAITQGISSMLGR